MNTVTQQSPNSKYVMSSNLPAIEELAQYNQFLGWRFHPVPGKEKPTKKPHNARTGKQDDSNVNPEKWVSLQEALDAQEIFEFDGIGFACTKDDPFTFIDLDDSISDDGSLTPYAQYVVDLVDSCFFITPSGKGLRGIVRGKLGSNLGADIKGDGDCKLELKESGGYMTITGNHWPGSRTTIEERETELEILATEAKERRRAAKKQTFTIVDKPEESRPTGDTPYGLSALRDECQDLATTPAGGRNTRLNLAAFRLGQLVAGGELTCSTVEYELLDAAARCGLDDSESRATFKSGVDAGIKEPRSAPIFERMHDAPVDDDETASDLDSLTLEKAKTLIISLRQENAQLKAKDAWWDTIMANPNLKTIQKLMIRQRITVEQNTKPGRKRDGKWYWRIDTEQDGKACGSDSSSISRNIPYLEAGGVLDTWNEPVVLKNGVHTHIVWSRLTGAEKLPAEITVPSKWGGKTDRCTCGGEFKVKSRVIERQRVGTCKSCGKVRVFQVEKVKSPLPVTPIFLDDETACEAHSDDLPVHDASDTLDEEFTPPDERDETPPTLQSAHLVSTSMQNATVREDIFCQIADCTSPYDGYAAGKWLCGAHYDAFQQYRKLSP